MSELIQDLSLATFDALVTDSELPVLVDFWAPWCGPCKMLAPVIDQLAEEYDGRLKVMKCNMDEINAQDPEAGKARFQVAGIPALVIYRKGQEVTRVVGVQSRLRLRGFIDKGIAADAD
ncbi:thioredoxin [Pseudomonas fluorescens]|jgi:thioredoxin 1|uniref:thioredoxin n=1 Tax=Pseudomonas fluorescens TaxID=294 RepID=UPI00083D57E2|nr:thioredoxin [Pseudomonas fluorescens]AOE68308.1 thioredoxin [Pseudomonas fluorescens]AOE74049.1 thioredoxin [Pseudomonas fluorescens]